MDRNSAHSSAPVAAVLAGLVAVAFVAAEFVAAVVRVEVGQEQRKIVLV